MCIHHWRIASPNGQSSVSGRCEKCGAEREFAVAIADWNFEFSRPNGRLSPIENFVERMRLVGYSNGIAR